LGLIFSRQLIQEGLYLLNTEKKDLERGKELVLAERKCVGTNDATALKVWATPAFPAALYNSLLLSMCDLCIELKERRKLYFLF
jgi:hypothetical protein